MAYNVLRRQMNGCNPFDTVKGLYGMAQTRRYAARQINLAKIAGDDHSGISPRRVRNIFICTEVAFLRLIEYHVRVRQGAAAHESQRSDLDFAAFEFPVDLLQSAIIS